MNHDDEARRLINEAMRDAYADAPRIDSLGDLVADLARQLWQDPDAKKSLRAKGAHAQLLSLVFHDLGQHNDETPDLHRGGVMVTSLARIDAVESDLLAHLTAPQTPHAAATGYAIAHYVTPDDEPPALLVIVALRNNADQIAMLWGLANDSTHQGDILDLDDDRLQDDLRNTAQALAKATARTAAQ